MSELYVQVLEKCWYMAHVTQYRASKNGQEIIPERSCKSIRTTTVQLLKQYYTNYVTLKNSNSNNKLCLYVYRYIYVCCMYVKYSTNIRLKATATTVHWPVMIKVTTAKHFHNVDCVVFFFF